MFQKVGPSTGKARSPGTVLDLGMTKPWTYGEGFPGSTLPPMNTFMLK